MNWRALYTDQGQPIKGQALQEQLEKELPQAKIRDCGQLTEALHHGRRRTTRNGFYIRGSGR